MAEFEVLAKVISVLAALFFAGCLQAATADEAASAPTIATAPPSAVSWHRAELYFGIGIWHGVHAARDDKRWRDFLDREVTPRFPDGLSVLDAYGQWLQRGAKRPERLHSKVLVIVYEATLERSADLDSIRTAWKKLTGDVSVLRVDTPVDISF